MHGILFHVQSLHFSIRATWCRYEQQHDQSVQAWQEACSRWKVCLINPSPKNQAYLLLCPFWSVDLRLCFMCMFRAEDAMTCLFLCPFKRLIFFRPIELAPGCWRGGCKFPHGEDRKDDQLHGMPYEGVSKTLVSGRTMKGHAPAKRKSWAASRPRSAPADFNPSPWSGYAAFQNYF